VTIRPARAADAAPLGALDAATWSPLASPAPPPPPGRPWASPLEGVLVAEEHGELLGYVDLRPATPLPASAHVREIRGLAVAPAAQRRGVGAALLEAAAQAARATGARRLTLRVLAGNAPARALYAAAGFAEEGVRRGEFHLEGRDVDDVLMSRAL